MPRSGDGTFSLAAGYQATDGQTATAAQHNDPLEDLETVLNENQPITKGGTGASSASGARTNLSVPGLSDNNIFSGTNEFDDDGFLVRDPADTTKKARLDVGSVTAGQTRVITIPDRDLDLADPVFDSVYLGGTGSANQLDDYEEGTWTPAAGANSGLAGTFSTYSGRYVKVGRRVFCEFTITGTSMSFTSTTAYFQLTGLPFTCAAQEGHGVFCSPSNFPNIVGQVVTVSSGTACYLHSERGSSSANSITGTFQYEAA